MDVKDEFRTSEKSKNQHFARILDHPVENWKYASFEGV